MEVVHLTMLVVVFQDILVEMPLIKNHQEIMLMEEACLVEDHLVLAYPMVMKTPSGQPPGPPGPPRPQGPGGLPGPAESLEYKDLLAHKDYKGFLIDDSSITFNTTGLETTLTDRIGL